MSMIFHQDQIVSGKKKKKGKYDNYSMKTYIYRDLESSSTHDKPDKPAGLSGDFWNILILLLLYTIQGIPIGLSGSVPILMKERGSSYASLSLFSMVSIPFSIKLIWAPIIDSVYFKSVGRRKTWLIPIQLSCGLVMIVGAMFIDGWLGSNADGSFSQPDATTLTVFFLVLYFLMATQDIVVDGWALTMLSRENVGYQSPCNNVGQIIGIFLANQGFIALSDPIWCKEYIPDYLNLDTSNGLVTLAGFINFWGWFLIVVTIFLTFFKTEIPCDASEEPEGVLATYKEVGSIFKIRPVQLLCLVLFTCRAAFGPVDAASSFKFQEYGMPKSDMAAIGPVLLLFSLIMPTFTGGAIANAPIDMFLIGTVLKICASGLVWAIFQMSIRRYQGHEDFPHFNLLLIIVMGLHELSSNLMSGSLMAFFSKIADPSIGGTYMTLLNTISNLGSKWPSILALWALPKMTYTACQANSIGGGYGRTLFEDCREQEAVCLSQNGTCNTTLDGYSVQIFIGMVIGVVWLLFFGNILHRLQHLQGSDWLTNQKMS
jgi:PAT family acetyl-CoA transporter-like MFS transporter 1